MLENNIFFDQSGQGGLLTLPEPLMGYDESRGPQGERLPEWDRVLPKLAATPEKKRAGWRTLIQRHLREDGLTFSLNHDPDHAVSFREEVNPVPWIFSSNQWAPVASGVAQRARLLEAVVRDLTGSQSLIHRGVLPAELLFSDRHYLRPTIGLPSNLSHKLFHVSMDLARGPGGRFWVLEDRAQAPGGAGIALECRTILGRIFPELLAEERVCRLAPYFREFREALLAGFQGRQLDPRVVVLTPGPYNSSYFEHAYLATYLGYTLVQGSDLLIRDGALKLKTLEGLQPVELVLRYVDADYLDPLEFRNDSILGVPGLTGSMRSGRTAMANHPGCGILENAGLMAFYPSLCQELLGEEMEIPSLATWWCGQPRECQYVLDHAHELIIKPLHRSRRVPPVDGRVCTAETVQQVRDRIRANPRNFVGQEPMAFSTIPTLVGEELLPRTSVLRSFAFAKGDSYQVMPGGMGRSARETDAGTVGLDTSGWIRDVWVTGGSMQAHRSLWTAEPSRESYHWFTGVFTSRSGENLFWAGRYAERLMRQARLLRGLGALWEQGESSSGAGMSRLLDLLEIYGGRDEPMVNAGIGERLDHILRGGAEDGSVLHNLKALMHAAYAVRDIWSQDTWRTLTSIEQLADSCCARGRDPLRLDVELGELVEKLNAFYGLNSYAMTRESGWTLLMLGRVIESGVGLSELVSGLLIPRPPDTEPSYGILELALQQNENLITYRRHYRTTPRLQSVLFLMLTSETNPRSLVYFLEQVIGLIDQLPPANHAEDELEAVLTEVKRLRSRVQEIRDWGKWAGIASDCLFEARMVLEKLSGVLSSTYFSHTAFTSMEKNL